MAFTAAGFWGSVLPLPAHPGFSLLPEIEIQPVRFNAGIDVTVCNPEAVAVAAGAGNHDGGKNAPAYRSASTGREKQQHAVFYRGGGPEHFSHAG